MEQDQQALNQLTNRIIFKQRMRRRPSFIPADNSLRTFRPGDRAVWLWQPIEDSSELLPIPATILQVNSKQAHIRADFVVGSVVLWVGISRLRAVKKGR